MLGHSFVRRMFYDGFQKNQMELDFTRVVWKGWNRNQPINLIKDVSCNIAEIMDDVGEIDVMFLFLGSNDLITFEFHTPETVADWLFNLAKKLLDQGVKRVCFTECLPRFGARGICRKGTYWGVVNSIDQDEIYFADRVVKFNNRLKFWVEEECRMGFQPLFGFREDIRNLLYDGIHLDGSAREKLRVVLQRAVLVESHKALSVFVRYDILLVILYYEVQFYTGRTCIFVVFE